MCLTCVYPCQTPQVSHIVQVLKSCNHNGFPVYQTNSVDGDRSLAGVVLRQHVLLLLTTRNAFQTAPYVTEVRGMQGHAAQT